MENYHTDWVKSIALAWPAVPIYHPSEIKAIETQVFRRGVDPFLLMKRAGLACWQVIQRYYPGVKTIGIVCGGGNNGGDGWIVARLAALSGVRVKVLYTQLPGSGPAALAYQWAQCESVLMVESLASMHDCDVIVDALLGIGLVGELRPQEAHVIDAMNHFNKKVVAIDIPSGLCAATGEALPIAVMAHHTVTLIGLKVGLVTGQAARFAGSVMLAGLGLEPADHCAVESMASLVTYDVMTRHRPVRLRDAHKGTCGHVLVVGGGEQFGGAVMLAAQGALKAGAGKVSVACHVAHRTALLARAPEVMWVDPDHIEPALNAVDVVVMGMGLGQDEWARALFQKVMWCSNKPLILDADGLNIWAANPRMRAHTIITPHPGEAQRLLQGINKQIESMDRIAQAACLSQLCPHGVVVLKGSGSVIHEHGQKPLVSVTGNAGMATGGMGDILAGIIGGFVGQGVSLVASALLGVYLHGWWGDEMANCQGLHALTPSALLHANDE